MKTYDAIIVGSGPNGFAAAITLQRQGLSTLLIEGADKVGGGLRTEELTLEGYKHDVCSAIHPMALSSAFFQSIPLADYGLKFIQPTIPVAHPLDNGEAGILYKDIFETARELGRDEKTYLRLLNPLVDRYSNLAHDTMGPLRFPKYPIDLCRFGMRALPPATWLAKLFDEPKSKALWAGMVGHSIQPLSNFATSAYGLMLMTVGHKYGWPIPIGGSTAIAQALLHYYQSLGGEVHTGLWVKDSADLPAHKLLFLDMTPRQILKVKGLNLQTAYKNKLINYRQGMGVFKVDWALSEPVPFTNLKVRKAGTVHLGGTFDEIAAYEKCAHQGKIADKPFVLFAQQSVFDSTRAPEGKHTGWAYCHVPNGIDYDYTNAIENQIERFAPGFKDIILAKHTFSANQMEAYNPNYVGGDINGGLMDLGQLYTRPIFSLTPYRTSNKKVYICSSSTPPAGGVHGMCGFHAAKVALKDHYGINVILEK